MDRHRKRSGAVAGLLARPWAPTALRWGAVDLAVLLFLLSLQRAGRLAEGLKTIENADAVHRRMLELVACAAGRF